MIILIPLGGLGKRFKNNNFKNPKGLIDVSGKIILFWLLDNLKNYNFKNEDFIYIPYNKEYSKFNLEKILQDRYKDIKFKFLKLKANTRGAGETISIALDNLDCNDTSILCIDGDNFYTTNIKVLFNNENSVFYFNDKLTNPIYSYINFDNNKISDIIEKEKISDNACCGCYGFKSYQELNFYCKKIITNNIKYKDEFYISTVIKEMIKDNHHFIPKKIECKNYYSLGTPQQVEYFNKVFLFDLDGTLVRTDHLYTKVWKKILKRYNFNIDENFFNNFIKGKSDKDFLRFFIPEITKEDIISISNEKDRLFSDELDINKNNILIEGVLDFFENNKNRRIAIVTNCNKNSAEKILKLTKLDKFVSLLISAEDCEKTKPHPEPYNKAIKYFNVEKQKCIIFEDSLSGYTSAKKCNVGNIIIVLNDDSPDEINNLDEIKIYNYKDLNIKDILDNQNTDIYTEIIEKKLSYLPIKKIKYSEQNLKTGYICDIDMYDIYYYNNKKDSIILKISNFDNELSKTAIKLNMYYNEGFFYEYIAKVICNDINIPNNYGLINVNSKIGILLENLNKFNGSFNLNLNNNINLLLRVINDISKIHKKYYFKNKDNIISIMKELKIVNQITYYKELIEKRFNKFLDNNNLIISQDEKIMFTNIYNNFDKIQNKLSSYPLNFCHGDLKSPNIFYLNNTEPYFLDWQYIHLNKGVSDIVFLLVESINFNINTVTICEKYYYKLIESTDYPYEKYLEDFKLSLCMFPFFVTIWFNSEASDKLIDKVFPIRFMKNLIKYLNYYIEPTFFI